MPTQSKPDTPQLEDGLREIDALVKATLPGELAPADASEQTPDLEAVARELGISVDEVREMMATNL